MTSRLAAAFGSVMCNKAARNGLLEHRWQLADEHEVSSQPGQSRRVGVLSVCMHHLAVCLQLTPWPGVPE
jgi:hypothetical protein